MFSITHLTGSILLALIPALVWGHIFFKKNPGNKKLSFLTFVAGALSVFPILIYKTLWDYFPWINAFKLAAPFQNDIIGFSELLVIPLSIVISFMIVGVIEEVMKLLAVKTVDRNRFESIDDAMEFFIIAALGFSFTENILYFYNIMLAGGAQEIFMPFLLRSTFSTFAHILFSGILGYYYGTAHFAKPILQEELRKKRKHWTRTLHKILGIRKEKLFHQERLIEGLLIAIGLHAIFNIFLEMQLTFMVVPFLIFGYFTLNYLFKKKENHTNYKKLLVGSRNNYGGRPTPMFQINIIN